MVSRSLPVWLSLCGGSSLQILPLAWGRTGGRRLQNSPPANCCRNSSQQLVGFSSIGFTGFRHTVSNVAFLGCPEFRCHCCCCGNSSWVEMQELWLHEPSWSSIMVKQWTFPMVRLHCEHAYKSSPCCCHNTCSSTSFSTVHKERVYLKKQILSL